MAEEDIILIVNSILDKGISLNNITYISILLISLISGSIGAFLASYAKTKGKNYATKEDFDELFRQTRQLTEATELVKFGIANSSRIESKKWELKLDIYANILESLSKWRVLINSILTVAYNKDGSFKESLDKRELDDRFSKMTTTFENIAKIEALSELVLNDNQAKMIREIHTAVNQGLDEKDNKKAFEKAVENIKELEVKIAKKAKEDLFTSF